MAQGSPLALFYSRNVNIQFIRFSLETREVDTMQFGFELFGEETIWNNVSLGMQVEKAGFDKIWATDHYTYRNPYVLLSILSAYTKEIKVGPGILTPLVHHPANIASSVATLDELTNGRAILGLGPGDKTTMRSLHKNFKGITAILRDAITVIRQLWQGQKITRPSPYYPIKEGGLQVLPHHPIPIYIAAHGTKVLQLAAELAEGVLVNSNSLKLLKEAKNILDQGSKKRVVDAPLDTIASLVVSLADTQDQANDQSRFSVAMMVSGSHESITQELGLDQYKIIQIRECFAKGQFPEAEALVTDRMLEHYSCSGTEEVVLEKLTQIKNLGYDEATVFLPRTADRIKSLKIFKELLIPELA